MGASIGNCYPKLTRQLLLDLDDYLLDLDNYFPNHDDDLTALNHDQMLHPNLKARSTMRTSSTLTTSQLDLDDYLLDIGDDLARVTSTNYRHSVYDTGFLRYNLPLFVNRLLVRHCDYSSFYEPHLNQHTQDHCPKLKPSDTIDKVKAENSAPQRKLEVGVAFLDSHISRFPSPQPSSC
ncbi:hypothetical protein R3P38DRAFT_3179548 [Favolaschia claudopus]|uniref:Uncharacterized protein n=1 Tax=Favolaschia claudopus TaxID=2862362 RepID=A0AAW0CRW5_9AGAR